VSSGTTASLPLYYRKREKHARRIDGSSTVVGAVVPCQAVLPLHYRFTTVNGKNMPEELTVERPVVPCQAVLPHSQAVLPLGWFQKAQMKTEGMLHVAGRVCGCIWFVYVLIPPIPFQCGPPLNSTGSLRLKSTKKKSSENNRLRSLSPRGNKPSRAT